jgi:hypothetical protein
MEVIGRRIRRTSAALVAAAAIAVASAGGAGAVSPPVAGGPGGADVCSSQATAARASVTVASLRTFGECEIARRQTTLAQLSNVIKASKALTPADASALNAAVAAAGSELARLKSNLDSEVTVAGERATIVQIVTRVRVYVLVVPQVRLTIAADDVLSLQPHLASLTSALADRIARAQAAGRDVTAARQSLDDMQTALDRAESLAQPWPARLVALTPADFDSGVAGPRLQQARTALGSASAQLKLALGDGRAILRDLR